MGRESKLPEGGGSGGSAVSWLVKRSLAPKPCYLIGRSPTIFS